MTGPVMADAAYSGLAGEVVRTIEPHTEADSAGLLLTFLAGFGAAVGRGPRAVADGSEHPGRLAVLLIGPTAKGRKGTTWQQVRRVLSVADPDFVAERILGGFGSGEALVDAVAEGEDRRLFVVEPEWGRLLAVGRREGATLSPLVRQAWDGDRLAIRSRAGKAVADGAHVCVLGHITADELRSKLLEVEVANGFANRHLFCVVRRSKLLPSGGDLDDATVGDLGRRVRRALERARRVALMRRSSEAEATWAELYGQMAADEPPGLVGALIARDAPQVLRLSVIYALLDGCPVIGVVHLEAAWAVWRYCRASVEVIFGERTGDVVADKLLDALRQAPDGLTGTEQSAVLGRNVPAERMTVSRDLLVRSGLAAVIRRKTGERGRPTDVLVLLAHEDNEVDESIPTSSSYSFDSYAHPADQSSHDDDCPPPDDSLFYDDEVA